jgi:hypothetical protein
VATRGGIGYHDECTTLSINPFADLSAAGIHGTACPQSDRDGHAAASHLGEARFNYGIGSEDE